LSSRSSKRVAAVQSCYVPWKGYFDLINSVDEFVLYDHVQYTRQDWRNRNRIKTERGTKWLTIPVTVYGLYEQRLDETTVADRDWARSHWETVRQAYREAPFFTTYADPIAGAYEACSAEPLLSRVNRHFLETICGVIGIQTRLRWSTDYGEFGGGTSGLVALCHAARATTYLSGPRGRDYIEEELFAEAGIELAYYEYDGYPEYRQLHEPFEHTVSILDLLFNVGPDAPTFMKSFGSELPVSEASR
jgi:hypothetical protein